MPHGTSTDRARAVGIRTVLLTFLRESARPIGARVAAIWHHPFSPERRKSRIARIQAGWNRGPSYDEWIENFDYSVGHDRSALIAEVGSFTRRPLISVLMPTYN